MRVLIVCGGTGGHLTPGIAVAQKLQLSGHDVLLATSEKAVDKCLSSNYTYLRFITLPGTGLSWRPIRFLYFLMQFLRSLFISLKLLGKRRIDVVLAFGGYISFGVGIAAFLRRKPLILHESNQLLGKSTRVLSRFAQKVFIPPAMKIRKPFAKKNKYFAIGFPLREDFQTINKQLAREQLGFDQNAKMLLVSGGSQGAQALIEWVKKNDEFFSLFAISILCLTGPGGEERVDESLHGSVKRRVQFLPFSNQMHVLYGAADLVLSRAGAGTIAELIASATPSILVPYPHAANDHQSANASMLQSINGALVVKQKDMHTLIDIVKELFDTNQLQVMERQLQVLQKIIGQDAAQRIANEIIAITSSCDGKKER
jgi:UDP-N-acetylglucosamine--N-acetylmuramyl-(pentapeptide) pyrophosphoryl-undecaprenol N-acetylglucosamine transferase